MMPLSIIIPWKASKEQRVDNFKKLLKCIDAQVYRNFEVIIVEQHTPSSLKTDIESTIVLNTDYENFNKSWCINVGARQSKYNQLVIMDADSLFETDFFDAITKFCLNSPIFLCWNSLVTEKGRDNPNVRVIDPKNLRTLGGIWSSDKDFFFNQLGGMNESYFGYGGEDNGAHERACFILGRQNLYAMYYTIRHQYHHWERPNELTQKYFAIERSNPQRIIEALKRVGVGNPLHPTPLNMEIM